MLKEVLGGEEDLFLDLATYSIMQRIMQVSTIRITLTIIFSLRKI